MLNKLQTIMTEASALALSHFRNVSLIVSEKSPKDFVTEADQAVESLLKKDSKP